MKKNFFFLAAAALAFASCSVDETLEVNQGEAIGFRTVVNGNTRATAKTAFADADVINVYADYAGSKYFQDNFTFATGEGFHSANKYYWPATVDASNAVTFSAIYKATQVADAPGTISAFTPAAEVASQVDVLFAKTKVENVSAQFKSTGVVLNFRHALSQVVVKVKNSNPNMVFDIKEVKFAFLNTAGNFNGSTVANTDTKIVNSADVAANHLTQAMWTGLTPASPTYANAYTQTSASANFTSSTATALGEPWMLVPQSQTAATAYTAATAGTFMNGSYIAVKMVIKNAEGGVIADGATANDGVWCCWPATVNWTPGYKYNYVVELSDGGYFESNQTSTDENLDPVLGGNEIFFSAACTIDEWVDADGAVNQLP